MDMIKTGAFLKELRNEKGITQEELAEKFGVSNRTVSRWETGKNMPDISLLLSLCEFYDVDIRDVLAGERKNDIAATDSRNLNSIAEYAAGKEKISRKRLFRSSLFSLVESVILFQIYYKVGLGHVEKRLMFNTMSVVIGYIIGFNTLCVFYSSGLGKKISNLWDRFLDKNSLI